MAHGGCPKPTTRLAFSFALPLQLPYQFCSTSSILSSFQATETQRTRIAVARPCRIQKAECLVPQAERKALLKELFDTYELATRQWLQILASMFLKPLGTAETIEV